MVANPVTAEGQSLNPDALVELYELDTAPLFTVNGVLTAGSQVYRWTSGMIDITSQGALPDGGTISSTVLTLDRRLPLRTDRQYILGVELPNKTPSPPIPVLSFVDVTLGTIPVTEITLALPLDAVPLVNAPWMVAGANTVKFRGNEYQPLPIEATGFEWAAQGKLPRPRVRVSNIGNLASALVIAYGDMLGARLTRLRTFAKFLDGGSNADPSAFVEPDIYLVDRKSAHNKTFVEWELAAALDQQGKRIPGHIMLRDTCQHRYRQWVVDASGTGGFVYGTCPYTGGAMFTAAGDGTEDVTKDVCGLLMSDCLLRFGPRTPLPRDAFPGIAILKF